MNKDALAYIQLREHSFNDLSLRTSQLEDHIRDLLKMVPKWISVEERLPTSEDTSANGLVICVCRGEDDKPIVEEVHAWHIDVVRRMAPCFTHWMPMNWLVSLLPEPPKEG